MTDPERIPSLHQVISQSAASPESLRTSSAPSGISFGQTTPASQDASRKRSLSNAAEPPQKRKVTRACDICKAKKSKCSGDQPCESCSRRGLNCQYEARYSRGKAPTPPRAGPGRSEAIASPKPYQSTLDGGLGSSASSTGVAFETVNRVPHHNDNHTHGQTTRDAEAPREAPSRGSPGLEVAGQFSDSTSGLSFLHRAWRRISNNQNSRTVDGYLGLGEDSQLLTTAGDKPFQDTGHITIPPLARCHELLVLYFDVCIATYRLLHRPSVEHWLHTVKQNAESNQPLYTGIGRPRAAIVLTVLAIATFHEQKARTGALGASPFPPVNGEPSLQECDGLFSEARRFTESETGFPIPESAQSRLIQVLYLLMSSRMNQAWYVFGHALQIISALGLHRREDRKRSLSSQKMNYIEHQCKKRTFWVAYTLDKYLGFIFGRPRHYHDDDIDQDFPDSVNDEDMSPTGPLGDSIDDCHIVSLVFHAKLAQIAEKISREIYSIKAIPDHERLAASHRLGIELREWRASLPPFLGAINPSSLISSFRRQATALKLAYCHAVMLAHRPFLLKNTARTTDNNMKNLTRECIHECISAAQSVLESVDRMAREGRLFHAFWWTHYVCFCALVVVYVWTVQESSSVLNGNEINSAKLFNQAERCLNHLAQATATNSPSRRYSIILRELRAEAKRKTSRLLLEQAQNSNAQAGPDEQYGVVSNSHLQSNPTPVADAAAGQQWVAAFGSPEDNSTFDMTNFLDDWRTTDWLDLDSSAFVQFQAFEGEALPWIGG